MPRQQQKEPQRLPRAWYLDALSAFAYGLLALVLGKGASRTLGPIAALFVFALLGGLSWLFARSAWRGLQAGREGKGAAAQPPEERPHWK